MRKLPKFATEIVEEIEEAWDRLQLDWARVWLLVVRLGGKLRVTGNSHV